MHTCPAGRPYAATSAVGNRFGRKATAVRITSAAAARMLELTRSTLVFNLLHHRTLGKDKSYAYYNPQQVIELLSPTVARIRLLDDYLPNDFTVICEK